MDLMRELERITSPPFVSSQAKVLDASEIAALDALGMITPLHMIPMDRSRPRVSFPECWNGGHQF